MFSLPFTVERSISLDHSKDKVLSVLTDFSQWTHWSPWLSQEPSCIPQFSGNAGEVGHTQSWDGKYIGKGEMELIGIDDDSVLDYRLDFLKPWKSHSKVKFAMTEKDGRTHLTWSMAGTIPIFLFFLKKMMKAFIGDDYERGLMMLDDFLRNGKCPIHISNEGTVESHSFVYFANRTRCKISELKEKMDADFTAVYNASKESGLGKPDYVFTIYHKFDLVKGIADYSSGLGYQDSSAVSHFPEGFTNGSLPKHTAAKYTLKGPYKYLGGAWSALFSYMRGEKLKQRKDIPIYEIYENDPAETPEENLKTSLYLPLKD